MSGGKCRSVDTTPVLHFWCVSFSASNS